jgi:hypothetical protein
MVLSPQVKLALFGARALLMGEGRLQQNCWRRTLPGLRQALGKFFSASLEHNTPLYVEGTNPNSNDPINGLKAHNNNKHHLRIGGQ